MQMKNYIELGEKKAGKQIELARILEISDSYIRLIKTGKKGLPVASCIKLADYIGADRLEVIAASNLVTEKDESKRKILESCFSRAATVAAAALILGASTIVSSPPANASQASSQHDKLCIMLNQTSQLRRKSDRIADVTAVTADNYFETSGQIN